MADLQILAGATSQSILVDAYILATGAAQTGLVFNSSGLKAYYSFTGANTTAVAITLATLATVTTAYSSGGFIEIDATNMPGLYRLDLPNAAIAAAKGRQVVVTLTGFAGMATTHKFLELTGVDNQDGVRFGMTALPNAVPDAAGGLPVTGNRLTAIPVVARVTLVDTVTTYTGNTPQTGDAFARIGANGSGLTTLASAAALATVQVDTDDIQTRLPASLTGGKMESNIGSVTAGVIAAASFAANALDSVWSTAVRVLTAGTNIVLAKGVGLTGLTDLSEADVRTAIGMAGANLDTQLTTIDNDVLSRLPSASYTPPPTANANADALLDRADAVETGVTIRGAMRGIVADLLGKLSGAATTNILIRNVGDTKNVVDATVDADGNRSAVTLNLT